MISRPLRSIIIIACGLALGAGLGLGLGLGQKNAPSEAAKARGPRSSRVNKGPSASQSALWNRIASEPASSKRWAQMALEFKLDQPEDLPLWLAKLEEMPEVESREIARRLMLQSVGQSMEAAQKALSAMGKVDPESPAGRTSLGPLGRALVAINPDQALELATQFPDVSGFSRGIFNYLIDQGKGSQLVTHLLSHKDGLAGSQGFADCLKNLSEKDLPSARLLAEGLDGKEGQQAIMAVATASALQDPQGTVAWARGQKDQTFRRQLLSSIAESLANKNPTVALDTFLLGEGREGNSYDTGWLYTASNRKPKEFLAWMEKNMDRLPAEQNHYVFYRYLDKLAETDPDKTLQIMRDKKDVLGSASIPYSLVRNVMSKRGLKDTVAWLRSQPSDQQKALTETIAYGFSGLSSAEAKEFLSGTSLSDPLLGRAAASVMWKKEPQDLLRQLKTMDPASREAALSALRDNYSGESQSPEKEQATRDLIVLGAESKSIQSIAAHYVAAKAKTDPEGTAKWISQLPPGPAATIATTNLLNTWKQLNKAGAEAWVQSLPPESEMRKKGDAILNSTRPGPFGN
jgi:hypothetical protein